MTLFFYNIFLGLYRAGIAVTSVFNDKARKWRRGRNDIFSKLQAAVPKGEKIIWMHCASLGEFEQGRPLLEKLKANYPGHKILLTFFSPSGYEIQKNYKDADGVFYLPLDGRNNARRFLEIVQPVLVVFVKYEYWYYYLSECKKREIPLLLVSAVFREKQPFFQWYGGLHRKMLRYFTHIFLQNEYSKELLHKIEIKNATVSGDTRFDRVIAIARNFEPLPEIENFSRQSKLIVAGSTWPDDEKVLQKAFEAIHHSSLQLIIAPHEISAKHMDELKMLFPGSILYSELKNSGNQAPASRVLIIDNIGILSRLYHYATITYVGGGFKPKGLHNTLEAAVYGKPVIIGPNFKHFIEASGLINCKAASSIRSEAALSKVLNEYLQNTNGRYEEACKAANQFVSDHAGATATILTYIQEKRLLTN